MAADGGTAGAGRCSWIDLEGLLVDQQESYEVQLGIGVRDGPGAIGTTGGDGILEAVVGFMGRARHPGVSGIMEP